MKLIALSLAILVGFASLTRAEAPATRPNIVVFVSDDHGQDAGCYGNPVIKTPNIDALAKEGVRYNNAYCTTASCSASRSVILSGLHNHANGQYGLAHATHHFQSFSSLYTLPNILNDNGYRTARIGKYHVAPETTYHFQTTLPSAGGNRNSVLMADNCKDYLADKTKPFFLYFCVSDPHRGGGTLDKPGKPDAFGSNQVYPGVKEIVYDPKDVIVPPYLNDTFITRAEIAQYYQAVSRADQGVGRLVQHLKDAGQWDNTVFIYMADNGAPNPGSKTTLYEPGMKLPLIVRTPWLKEKNVARESMISWVDLTPTVLDFAGVKDIVAPPFIQGEPEDNGQPNPRRAAMLKKPVPYTFHGRSFRATLDHDDLKNWNTVYGSHQMHEITMYYPMRVIHQGQFKLIYNIANPLPFPFASDLYSSAIWQEVLKENASTFGKRRTEDFIHRPKYELYDLQNDPDEAHNLAADPKFKAVFDDLSGKLKTFQEKSKDPWVTKYVYE